MTVWQTVITVAATLIGTISGTLLGSVLRSRADTASRVHDWQVLVVDLYGDLMAGLDAHRAAMWDLEAARLREDPDEIKTTLAASLISRDALTRPHAKLEVLAPQLQRRITAAAQAVYALDTALDTTRSHEQLTARRQAAKRERAELERAMTAVLSALGVGLPVSRARDG